MPDKILILENNTALAKMWVRYLSSHGFDAELASTLEADKGKASQWGLPDIIVSGLEFDGQIPSGEEYCKNVYGDLAEKKLFPVIQMYSSYLSDKQKRNLAGSAFRLLQKPVKLSTLLGAVKKAHFKHFLHDLQKKHSPLMTAELSGQALTGIFQFVDLGKKSGVVLVETSDGDAIIKFREASLIHASFSNLTGEEAVLEVLIREGGHASFYETDTNDEAIQQEFPDIQTIITEAERQGEAIKHAEEVFSLPETTIHRDENAQISDKALFSDKIFMALESPKTLEELGKELSSLTYRQLMVALYGMISRREIDCEGDESVSLLGLELCESLLENLKTETIADIASEPVRIGVFSPSSTLSRRFVGCLAEEELAGQIILNIPDYQILITEFLYHQHPRDFADYAGIIVVFDREDTDSLPIMHNFLEQIHTSPVDVFSIAALRDTSGGKTHKTSISELLDLTDEDLKIVPIDWTYENCLKAFTALFESALENV